MACFSVHDLAMRTLKSYSAFTWNSAQPGWEGSLGENGYMDIYG